MQANRTSKVLALFAAIALVLAACGKSDSEGGGSLSYKVEAMPGLQGTAKAIADRGKVTIGVKGDQPNLGYKDPKTGEYQGFDIEIARMLAASLGVKPGDITFKQIDSKARETAIQRGDVDFYVGTYSIVPDRQKLIDFVGPYFIAGQDLLVRKDDTSITGPQSLAGKTVCSATGSTSIERIKTDYPKAKPVEFGKYSECVDQLLAKKVDAVTTDDAILLGYAAQDPDNLKVVGKPFSEERYGIGLKKGDTDLQNALAKALKEHEDNGDWKKAFEATLGKSGIKTPEIPAITEGKTS